MRARLPVPAIVLSFHDAQVRRNQFLPAQAGFQGTDLVRGEPLFLVTVQRMLKHARIELRVAHCLQINVLQLVGLVVHALPVNRARPSATAGEKKGQHHQDVSAMHQSVSWIIARNSSSVRAWIALAPELSCVISK